MVDPWPFAEPKQFAIITTRLILWKLKPILHVFHDRSDGGWHFLSGDRSEIEGIDQEIASLEEIVRIDPTVCKVASLPLGWHAWRRTRKEPWQWTERAGDATRTAL